MKRKWFEFDSALNVATISPAIKHPTKEMLEQILKHADDDGVMELTIKAGSREFYPALCTRSKLADNHRWEILQKVKLLDSSGNIMSIPTEILNSFYFNSDDTQAFSINQI